MSFNRSRQRAARPSAWRPLRKQRRRDHTARLTGLRTPLQEPESLVAPAVQPRFPLGTIVGQLTEAHPSICESRARARLSYLFRCICFLSRLPWDTLRPRVGHWGARQEPRVDLVVVDATRAPLASDDAGLDQIPQMTGHRALGQPGE